MNDWKAGDEAACIVDLAEHGVITRIEQGQVYVVEDVRPFMCGGCNEPHIYLKLTDALYDVPFRSIKYHKDWLPCQFFRKVVKDETKAADKDFIKQFARIKEQA